jgi:hypothetical protein
MVETLEANLCRLQAPERGVQAGDARVAQRGRQVGDLPAAQRDPHRDARETAVARQHMHERTPPGDRFAGGGASPPIEPIESGHELVFPPDDDLGRVRRGGRADVGDEVGDREVGLVADPRDDRDRDRRRWPAPPLPR